MLVVFFLTLYSLFNHYFVCVLQCDSQNLPLPAPETQPNEANEVTTCNALHMGLQIIFMHALRIDRVSSYYCFLLLCVYGKCIVCVYGKCIVDNIYVCTQNRPR